MHRCKRSLMPLWLTALSLAAVLLASRASAQIDFSGEWAPLYHEDGPERGPGPELGDYTEIPINEAARLRADSWDADRISVVTEYQCRPHGADYALRGLGNMRIWREIDTDTQRLIAFHMHCWPGTASARFGWMAGRIRRRRRRTPGRGFRPVCGKATR